MGNHYCSCLLNSDITNPSIAKNEELLSKTEFLLLRSSYTPLLISKFPLPEAMENRLNNMPSFLPLPTDLTIYKTPFEDFLQSSWGNQSDLPTGISRFFSPKMNIYFEGYLVPLPTKKTEISELTSKNNLEPTNNTNQQSLEKKAIKNPTEKGQKDIINPSNNLTSQKYFQKDTHSSSRTSVEGFGLAGVVPEGRGRLLTSDLNLFEGEFKNDFFNFEGSMKNEEGMTLRGIFKNLLMSGVGHEEWTNGTKYHGYYEDGVKKGRGKLLWENENKSKEESYEGEFINDVFEGDGVYCWGTQKKYTGQWKNGQMHGEGVFNWKDGRIYKGEFKFDKKNGSGTLTWNDGRVWTGSWKDDKQEGTGEMTDTGGKKQIGIWEDGRRIRWLEEEELKEYEKNKKK